MTKNNALKQNKEEYEPDFDFAEIMDSSDDGEIFSEAMNSMIEVTDKQMMLTLELTKLAVTKCSAKDINEDDVFSIFRKASIVIDESFPLKALIERFLERS